MVNFDEDIPKLIIMDTHAQSAKAGTAVKQNLGHQNKELKTDMPLSEKDEVKNAEKRTRKALKDYL
jgi:hypothetical protein